MMISYMDIKAKCYETGPDLETRLEINQSLVLSVSMNKHPY
jgi:hypothetical protein